MNQKQDPSNATCHLCTYCPSDELKQCNHPHQKDKKHDRIMFSDLACDLFTKEKPKGRKIDDMKKGDFEPPTVSAAIAQLEILKAEDVINLLESIEKVEKEPPLIKGDIYTYRFYIKGKSLIIPSDKMSTFSMFSRRYLEEFDELAPVELKSGMVWSLFIKAISDTHKLIKVDNTTVSPEVFEAENILSAIRNTAQTHDRNEYAKRSRIYLEDSKVWVKAETWKELHDNLRIKSTPDRLTKVMGGYFINRTTLRCAEKSVWSYVFSSTILTDEAIILTGSNRTKHHAEG